ncbi:MAG: SIS domain-containing protein, partial [Akkermansiaceae bacterium]|nr:SIS domain-containing protein [Akkermansiaceae bacterium]
MDHLAKAAAVIRTEIEGIEAMLGRLDGSFTAAVDILREAVESRGKIVVVGVGKSGNIGKKIAATLNSTGATAVALNSQNALHGDLGIVSDGDTVLALSYSGETKELVDLL